MAGQIRGRVESDFRGRIEAVGGGKVCGVVKKTLTKSVPIKSLKLKKAATKKPKVKCVLELSCIQARKFFLKEESYFNFDLPKYFSFKELITKVSSMLKGKRLSDYYESRVDKKTKKVKTVFPCDCEDVNYIFFANKDGKYAWRPFQLIHPALYVSLVHRVTEKDNWKLIVERFKEFAKNTSIQCVSLPLVSSGKLSDKAVAIQNWWHSIEQKSIEYALDYEYVLHTDISDCYGSIYTHSIAWALHTKPEAKANRNNYDKFIGNDIDRHIRHMTFGQTNGIPQGSVLMDFISEMVLGYADLLLSERITKSNISDYHIIRYRDDYRIFTNNPQNAEAIIKHLTEILIDLGMRLNANKTIASHNVVEDSIKPDKLFWIVNRGGRKNLQEHLLSIHNLGQRYPNSGSLAKALNEYFNRIEKLKVTHQAIPVLVSILVDIAYKNPRVYPIASAILSKLLSLAKSKKLRDKLLSSIENRFKRIPNTGYLQIWIQRVLIKIERSRDFDETLCKKVNDTSVQLWNSDWLDKSLVKIIEENHIVSENVISDIDRVIKPAEVELFESKTSYPY